MLSLLVGEESESHPGNRISAVPASLKVLKSRTIYKGRVVQLRVDEVLEPGGVRATRELVCHPGSVVIIPILPDGRVVLVRQYRYAARQALWELVAGGLEPRETPGKAAHRELAEETGYRARQVKRLFDFFPSPGILNERMFLMEAHGLTRGEARPDSDERLKVGRFTRKQLARMLHSHRIRDAKTLVALLWHLYRKH